LRGALLGVAGTPAVAAWLRRVGLLAG